MTEKELIKKIRGLKQIKPRENWVFLTRAQILSQETESLKNSRFSILKNFLADIGSGLKLAYKPAFATITAFGLLIGAFTFTQNSLPGDFLYPLKKISEQAKINLVSEQEKPMAQFELASKKLEEIEKIVQTNQMKNLAPALIEFETTESQAKKGFSKLVKNKSPQEAVEMAKDVVLKLQAIKQKKEQVLASLNIEEPEQETKINQTTEKTMADILIKNLQGISLTESQQKFLDKAEQCYAQGDYSGASINAYYASYPDR